jgi:hypothetical protein
MLMTRRLAFLLYALIGISAHAFATDEPSAAQRPSDKTAKATGAESAAPPWHMVDLWWEFTAGTEHFESLSVDVTIDRNIPSAYNLYLSPVGLGNINGITPVQISGSFVERVKVKKS